jgi:hypothetical protein
MRPEWEELEQIVKLCNATVHLGEFDPGDERRIPMRDVLDAADASLSGSKDDPGSMYFDETKVVLRDYPQSIESPKQPMLAGQGMW